jgi:hypothetical protein
MTQFWQKTEERGRQTLAFWRRFFPLMKMANTTPDLHAADLARLQPLAQERDNRRTDARGAKQRELTHFRLIRSLNLAVPQLVAGHFQESHPLRQSLSAVYKIVPRSRELNVRRARLLIPIWKSANAALAERQPGAAIVREAVGVTELETLLADFPAVLQATVDEQATLRLARTALRTHQRQTDRVNKRAYLKFKAEVRTDPALGEILFATITREKSSRPRQRR